jgi:uncharacterized membrane protein
VVDPPAAPRIPLVDLARGTAVALMISYHFCYDLNYFGLAGFDFYHSPLWRGYRVLILSLFLGIAGVSLHLSSIPTLSWTHFRRRLGRIGACAGLVSVGSYLLFPQRWIYFGVLHFILAASLLALPFLRFPGMILPAAAGLLAAGYFVQLPIFDHPALHWVGLMTHKPATEDYVPVVPWLAAVLIGLAIGRQLSRPGSPPRWALSPPRHPAIRLLGAGGRHSLAVYMLHQPILMALLLVFSSLLGR